jgi:peptide-methionine (S)-S-oxide reductase
MEQAMFAAGCFWGVEQSFADLTGVTATEVGYSGGVTAEPTYAEVCTGRTGHAEVVRISYDPGRVSYRALLDHFWSVHDPTTPNRQGPDRGTQYRSAIYYYSDEQRDQAIDSARDAALRLGTEVVTEIAPVGRFWRAEEYHQRYFEKNPGRGCRI